MRKFVLILIKIIHLYFSGASSIRERIPVALGPNSRIDIRFSSIKFPCQKGQIYLLNKTEENSSLYESLFWTKKSIRMTENVLNRS